MREGLYETEVNKWFITQLRNELGSRKELENITIKLLLSTMNLDLQCG